MSRSMWRRLIKINLMKVALIKKWWITVSDTLIKTQFPVPLLLCLSEITADAWQGIKMEKYFLLFHCLDWHESTHREKVVRAEQKFGTAVPQSFLFLCPCARPGSKQVWCSVGEVVSQQALRRFRRRYRWTQVNTGVAMAWGDNVCVCVCLEVWLWLCLELIVSFFSLHHCQGGSSIKLPAILVLQRTSAPKHCFKGIKIDP